MTMAPDKVEELVQATLPHQAAMGPAVVTLAPSTLPTLQEQIANLIACRRLINVPHYRDYECESGMRIVGWVIHEDKVGLGETLIAVEKIAEAAAAKSEA